MRKILITTSALIAGVMAKENNNLTERYKASTLDEVKNIVTNIEKRPGYDQKIKLFIFDRDRVLIHRIGNECGSQHFAKWRELFINRFWKDKAMRKNYGLYESIIIRDHIKTLVDKKMPEYVSEMQDKGYKCIILTSSQNKAFKGGVVNTSHDIYKQELKDFKFDFARSWGELKPKFFGQKAYHSRCYADGIIYAHDGKTSNKSEALNSFFSYAEIDPDISICMDDNPRNLDDIEKLMKTKNKHFIGIQYDGYKQLPQVECYNELAEGKRFDWLVKTKKWLTPHVQHCYKVNGLWTIKEATTESTDTEEQNSEIDETFKLYNPHGTTESNNDTSFATLTQSP